MVKPTRQGRSDSRRGIAVVEFAMTALVLIVIAIAVFDFGIYALTFLSVQNAARAAVLRNSGGVESAADQSAACAIVLQELRGLPNIGASFDSQCTSAPLIVSASLCEGSGLCAGASATADGEPAVAVEITYTLPPLILIPSGPQTIKKTVRMKLRNVT